jgi:hypothetical protein
MRARQRLAALSVTVLLVANLARPVLAQTGVFVNGRELSIAQVAEIQRCMPVIPGNYWMDAQGTFGYVGSGPIGNLITACQQSSLAGSSAVTPDGGTSTVYGNGSSTYYGPNSSFIYSPDGGCMVDGVSCPN